MYTTHTKPKPFRKPLLFITLLYFFSCSTYPGKEQHPPVHTVINKETFLPPKFAHLQPIPWNQYFLIGPYRWSFEYNKHGNGFISIAGKENKTIFYKDLPHKKTLKKKIQNRFRNAPYSLPPIWSRHNGCRNRIGIAYHVRLEDKNVVVPFLGGRYYFRPDGTFINVVYDSHPEFTASINSKWKLNENSELFFSGRKFSEKDCFAFSESWVIIISKAKKKFGIYERRSGKHVKSYPLLSLDEEKTIWGITRIYELFRFVQTLDGFYITFNRKPVRWYGKNIINLGYNEKYFCYVSDEKKRCLEDSEREYIWVQENIYHRVIGTRYSNFYETITIP